MKKLAVLNTFVVLSMLSVALMLHFRAQLRLMSMMTLWARALMAAFGPKRGQTTDSFLSRELVICIIAVQLLCGRTVWPRKTR